MYQVIARKYRPQRFADVVNQDHVKRTLTNALAQERVGHGYIFSGQRGTGKTTMARILAKALNCEKRSGPEPCLACTSCREIAAGNSMDLVEIDAASNRRIDDIRELRENVRYRPVRDRYKVFIIDEAHQITTDAFNALLKTLEEPPEWVVFILCTTEPHEIPATIVSRCQGFPFRAVAFEPVVAHMKWICGQEGIEADDDALVSIALAGDGSIRDALSTLDQAAACFGNRLETKAVRGLLGVIPGEVTDSIVSALLGNDASALLATVDQVLSEGRNVQHFCGELVRYFRNLLVQKVAGADTRLVSVGPDERKFLAAHSAAFSQEDLMRYVQLLLELYRDLQAAAQPRFRLEVGLLKLLYAGHLQPIEEVLARLGGVESEGSGKGSVSASSAALSAARAESVRESMPTEPIPAVTEPHPEQFSRAEPRKEVSSTDVDLRSRVLAALRSDKSDHLADAVEHGTVSLEGDNFLIRSSADYRTTLELGVDSLETVVAKVVGSRVRVRLGDDLDETESRQIVSVSSAVAIGSGGNTEDSGAGDAEKRALADPAVQMIRNAFTGQIREVRNLRRYSQ